MRGLFRRLRDTRPRCRPALLVERATTCQTLEPRLLLAVDVLTYHNDNGRTGDNLAETTLTPTNVNAASFGKLGQVAVDGLVYAQPLIKTGVLLPDGTTHDLVFVATEHDSVYAFDANTLALVWQDSFINPAFGVTSVPSTDLGAQAVTPEVGITSTPVIDPSSNTIYVVSMTRTVLPSGSFSYAHQFHALDLATGAEKFGGPVTIQATVAGKGEGSVHGKVAFNSFRELQRSALLLSGGVVYVAFASYDDQTPFHGWVFGYNAHTLKRTTVLNVTPNGGEAGIWMSGDGPAADAAGRIYLATGNYGDTVLKLVPTARGLQVADYFTPYNQKSLNVGDQDLGSGGVMLLPNQPGRLPHLMVAADKEGTLYLINRDNMGHFNARKNPIVQTIPGAMTQAFDTPAYFNGTIYYAGAGLPTSSNPSGGDSLRAFTIAGGKIKTTPKVSPIQLGYPGATPSISANGASNGIVWVVQNYSFAAVLRAYDASDITHELYDSTQAGSRDLGGPSVKFAVPTVANGKVYVGGNGTLTLYGLLPQG